MDKNISEIRRFGEVDGNLALALEPSVDEAFFLDTYAVLGQLSKGSLSSELLTWIIANPRPEFYAPLWELSWTNDGQFRLLLFRALDRCHWDDLRSTDELLRRVRRDPTDVEGKECIRLLQRRGGFEVSKRASILVERGTPQEQLLGIQILGRLGDRRSFMKPYVLRVLCFALGSKEEDVSATAAENIAHWTELDFEGLVGHAIAHPQSIIRNTAKIVLFGMNIPHSLEGLIGLLTARDPILRREMVYTLKHAVMGLIPPANQILKSQATLQGGNFYELSHSENTVELEYAIATLAESTPVSKSGLKAVLMSTVLALVLMTPGSDFAAVTKGGAGIGIGAPTDLGENSSALNGNSPTYQPTDNPFEAVSLRALLRGREIEKIGMVEASRIQRWLKLRDRPIRRVLNNSRESWLLYRRMHPQLAASIVASATVPGIRSERERLDFRHLLRSVVSDINNGKHDHGAHFLQYLALLNGELASYLLDEASKQAMNVVLDDFIVRFGYLDRGTVHSKLFPEMRYHPALTQLTHDSREMLIDSLLNGWVTAGERDLAVYLDSLNYPTQVEGRIR